MKTDDVWAWASSIGSNTIDIVDRKASGRRPSLLRVPLLGTTKLHELRRKIEQKQEIDELVHKLVGQEA